MIDTLDELTPALVDELAARLWFGHGCAVKLPAEVTIYEVGPRDGLQNEARQVPTAEKIRFIDALVAAGHPRHRDHELRVAEVDPAARRLPPRSRAACTGRPACG